MNDTVTVVGENTIIRGNLEGDEDLTVNGRVEGTLRLTRTLLVVGNITASDFVQINEEGRMVGDISSPRVIVVSGASFRGHIDMGDLTARRSEGAPPPRPVASAVFRSPLRPLPHRSFRSLQPRPGPRRTFYKRRRFHHSSFHTSHIP